MKLFRRVAINSDQCDQVTFNDKKGNKVTLAMVEVSETHSAVGLVGKKYAYVRDEAADTGKPAPATKE